LGFAARLAGGSISVMNILKVFAALYVIQAATGFAVGFTIPWLHFFGVL
jgi:hypothetical protein